MTDNEITDYAKQLILEAVRTHNLADQSHETASSKTVFKTAVNDGGEVEFIFIHQSRDLGRTEWRYTPQLYVEREIRSGFELHSSEFMKEIWKTTLHNQMSTMVRLLKDEFLNILEFPLRAHEASQLIFSPAVADRPKEDFLKWALRIATKLTGSQMKPIYRLYLEERDRYVAPKFLFYDVYKEQLRLWKEVKRWYKRVARHEKSIEMLRIAYPKLEGDLLERACGKDSYESMPSAIALEAAARYVRAPVAGMGKSSLDRYLSQSKADRKAVSDEEARATLEQFVTNKETMESDRQKINDLIADQARKFSEAEQPTSLPKS